MALATRNGVAAWRGSGRRNGGGRGGNMRRMWCLLSVAATIIAHVSVA